MTIMALRPRGFTIIEMLAVMAILGILATAALPLVELSVRRAKERDLKLALYEIRQAIDAYKLAADSGQIARPEGTSGYPSTLAVLVSGQPSLKDGSQVYWLRQLPKDPFAPEPGAWVVRSYASPPHKPQPGADVFDVHSSSSQPGINGIPYSQW